MSKKNWLVEGLAKLLKEDETLKSVTFDGMSKEDKATYMRIYDTVTNYLETRYGDKDKVQKLKSANHEELVPVIATRLLNSPVTNKNSLLFVVISDAISHYVSDNTNKITEDKLPGGKGDDKSDEDFDSEELAKGIKHELEHTKDEKLAKEIAKDHLTEDPKYYTNLDAMEKKKKKKKLKESDGDRRQGDRRRTDRRSPPTSDTFSLIANSSKWQPVKFLGPNGFLTVHKDVSEKQPKFIVQTFKTIPGIVHTFSSEEEIMSYIDQSKVSLVK